MKQQLVEHESGYEMNIWSFAGFALSQSLLCPPTPRFVCASLSAAEPALATWPQLKMRKVDEKSKKFSVFLSRSPYLSVSPSLFLRWRNEMKFSVELPATHAPSKAGGLWWDGRFCWVAIAGAAEFVRHTETGTLLQLQLQQQMDRGKCWRGETHSRHI